MNLLLQPQDQWVAATLSDVEPTWTTHQNALIQTTRTTDRKFPTGALLTHLPGQSYDTIELGLSPGSEYFSGLVFNYRDEQNFALFVINSLSSRYQGGYLEAGMVVAGSYHSLFKEKFEEDPEVDCALTVSNRLDGLVLSFNHQPVFEWGGMRLVEALAIGLYSQQNDDAAFRQLTVTQDEDRVKQFAPPDSAGETETPMDSGPANGEDVFPVEGFEEDPFAAPTPDMASPDFPESGLPAPPTLQDYLEIKAPASTTRVEFPEVFTVPLDSFYQHLNNVVHAGKSDGSSFQDPIGKLLDHRPRRWYRELRRVQQDLELQQNDLRRKGLLRSNLQAQMEAEVSKTELDATVLQTLEKQFNDAHTACLRAQEEVDALVDRRLGLIREIRANGYRAEKADADSSLFKAGFPYVIRIPVKRSRNFSRIKPEPGFEFDDSKQWEGLEKQLQERLIGAKAISDEGKDRYLLESEALKQVAKGNKPLEGEGKEETRLRKIQNDITQLEASIITKEAPIADLQEEINAWKADKALLESGLVAFPDDPMYGISGPSHAGWSPWFLFRSRESERLDTWVKEKGDHYSLSPGLIYSIRRFQAQHAKKVAEAQEQGVFLEKQFFKWFEDGRIYRATHYSYTSGEYRLQRITIYHMRKSFQVTRSYGSRIQYSQQHTLQSTGFFYPEMELLYTCDSHIRSRAQSSAYTQGFCNDVSQRPSIPNFFHKGIAICDHFIAQHEAEIAEIQEHVGKLKVELNLLQQDLQDGKDNYVGNHRKVFFNYWNNPENDYLNDTLFQLVQPDHDPLTEIIVEQEDLFDKKKAIQPFFYRPTEDGYYNQFGQSLRDFMGNEDQQKQTSISFFPVLDADGNYSEELVRVAQNPEPSDARPRLPMIKFIETYEVQIGWRGYGLGELSHSINLFPGETKELVVEKKTRITTKKQLDESREAQEREHITSSFEDNLQDAFAQQDKAANSGASKTRTASARQGQDSESNVSQSSSSLSASVSVSAGWGWGSAEASLDSTSSKSSTNASSTTRAFSLAQSREGLRASNQSKDVFRKNVNNTVRKVADDTSRNNKVEFSSVSSEEYEESISRKEIIRLENPNVGRTVNYHFFQLQNQYSTSLKLTDVKIVINSGEELIAGSGIQDLRVFELEEFGKIFANSPQQDHDVLVSAVIARQVFKHYGNFLSGVTTGNGAIRVPATKQVDAEMVRVLSFTSKQIEAVKDRTELLSTLKDALDELKGIPFAFEEQVVEENVILSVNTGAYHMEAQVGKLPATEPYLEHRRVIEAQREQAEVDHLRAQTQAGIFEAKLPEGLTHLSYNDPESPES